MVGPTHSPLHPRTHPGSKWWGPLTPPRHPTPTQEANGGAHSLPPAPPHPPRKQMESTGMTLSVMAITSWLLVMMRIMGSRRL